MPKNYQQKTGNADLMKQGQTTTGQYGTNPDAQPTARKTPRDLTLK